MDRRLFYGLLYEQNFLGTQNLLNVFKRTSKDRRPLKDLYTSLKASLGRNHIDKIPLERLHIKGKTYREASTYRNPTEGPKRSFKGLRWIEDHLNVVCRWTTLRRIEDIQQE